MKNIIFYITLFICNLTFSQQLLPIQFDTIGNYQELILSGNTEYGSTSIKNDLINKFIKGGEITESIKNNSFNHHKLLNIVGIDFGTELEYRNLNLKLLKKENIGLVVKSGYFSIGSLFYTKDLFGLAFFGNDKYINSNANFSGSQLNFNTFQKVGLGIILKKSKSVFNLNYYNVSNYADGYINNGILYQPNDGFNDSLGLHGYFNSSTGAKFNKGFGLGLDFDFKISIDWLKDQKAYIQFIGKNIGLATISSGSTLYQFDSTYHYNGFKISELIGGNSILSDTNDIYTKLNIQKSIHKENIILPCMFQIGKIVDNYSTNKIQSFFGIRLYPTISYIPLAYIGGQYKFKNNFAIGLQESYGGFTGLRTGIYTNYSINKVSIGIASENIIGVINKKGNGQSLIVRLQCRF